MEETKEEKIELKSITADGESPPTTKVSSCPLPGPPLRKQDRGWLVHHPRKEDGQTLGGDRGWGCGAGRQGKEGKMTWLSPSLLLMTSRGCAG